MNEFIKDFANPKGKFGVWGIVALIALGVAMMVLPGIFLGQGSKPPTSIVDSSPIQKNSPTQLGKYEQEIATQLSQILGQVEGAGEVAVTVSLIAGPEQKYAQDTTTVTSNIEERDTAGGTRSTNETNEKTEVVILQNGSEALVIQERGPEIKGVLVVAEGANDPQIKAQLSQAVQTVLNLPAHRVMILPKGGR